MRRVVLIVLTVLMGCGANFPVTPDSNASEKPAETPKSNLSSSYKITIHYDIPKNESLTFKDCAISKEFKEEELEALVLAYSYHCEFGPGFMDCRGWCEPEYDLNAMMQVCLSVSNRMEVESCLRFKGCKRAEVPYTERARCDWSYATEG